MNREQAKLWARFSVKELTELDLPELAKNLYVLVEFSNGHKVEIREFGGIWCVCENPSFDVFNSA